MSAQRGLVFFRLSLQLHQIFLEAVEAPLPQLAVLFHPVRRFLEGLRHKTAGALLRPLAPCDQSGILQDPQMLGDCRSADTMGEDKILDRGFPARQLRHDRPPRRIRERGKHRVERFGNGLGPQD